MITCRDIIKIFHDPVSDFKIPALRGLDLHIKEGELVSIIGPSGSGKTTLVNILSGLDLPTSGSVEVMGNRIDNITEAERREFRLNNLGMINQFISENLFSNLTVKQNLAIPKKMQYLPTEHTKKEVSELLEMLNLNHVKDNIVAKLSGGEAMRLSLGTALAKNPKILLADEPTGQLDTKHTQEMIETIKQVNIAMGKTVIVVTHDIRFRNVFEKSFIIRDGRLVGISRDTDRSELDFLMHSSAINRAYIDSSNFVRIPDSVKTSTALSDTVEFDTHPSKKIGVFWNPDILARDQVYELINNPIKDEEEDIDAISYEDVEPLLSRSFITPEKQHPIVEISNLMKGYDSPSGFNTILSDFSLSINQGDFVFISGPSGVGKTTLLNLISGLDKPNEGEVKVMDFDIIAEKERDVSLFRLQNIAFITQHNNLFDPLQVKDNLDIPYLFHRGKIDQEYCKSILKECHIEHKLESYPLELSAGEKQRAALATALTRKTNIILADEPSANLDSELARTIMDLLMDIARINNVTVIMCSHDLTLLRPGFRHIQLDNREIASDERVTKDMLRNIVTDYLQIKNNTKKIQTKKRK